MDSFRLEADNGCLCIQRGVTTPELRAVRTALRAASECRCAVGIGRAIRAIIARLYKIGHSRNNAAYRGALGRSHRLADLPGAVLGGEAFIVVDDASFASR